MAYAAGIEQFVATVNTASSCCGPTASRCGTCWSRAWCTPRCGRGVSEPAADMIRRFCAAVALAADGKVLGDQD